MSLSLFAFLAGAVQMVAPDRWMPGSVLAWQRGWTSRRTIAFSLMAFALHIALGFALYALFAGLSSVLAIGLTENSIGEFTLIFLGIIGAIRAYRFSRPHEVLYRPGTRRAIWAVLSLLGPSEMAIPILLKARMDGAPLLTALLPLCAGTLLAGSGILLYARSDWNKPFALGNAIQWCGSKAAVLPMAAGALIGLVLMITRV